jgi:acetylglutamate/LysW-gamma-L-alpha-aminoadipate kinase
MYVLKIGGGAGVDYAAVLNNLAMRVRAGERWLLVHGCSAEANRLAEAAGYPPRTLATASGHNSRYTDPRTLTYFCQAAANVNCALCAGLSGRGVPTRAFAAPGVLRGQRHTAIRARVNGRPVVIRDDYSGSITSVDAEVLRGLLAAGVVPVVAPLAQGTEGEALNVDGDLAAAQIATALGAGTLVILSNIPGLLRDVNEPSSLVSSFARAELPRYEPLAHGRMKKKLMAAAQACHARVILADSRLNNPLDAALAGGGTHIGSETTLNPRGAEVGTPNGVSANTPNGVSL